MTTSRITALPDESVRSGIRWINRGLEFLWLFTLVAVPLAFVDRESFLSELELAYVDVPKTVLLRTLAGLMAILWLIEWALQRQLQTGFPFDWTSQHRSPQYWIKNFANWVRAEPTRWVTAAVVLYLASTLVSTVLSESFSVSMWGLVPGQDTYPAYTITCYILLFSVVATHVRSTSQAKRILWAVALAGVIISIYSWAQFYGHDVFNLREIPGSRPSGSTLGNPILAGSVLLITLTISLAASAMALGRPVRSGKFWGMLALWTVILTLQITALIYSSGRGPWVGTIAGLFVFMGLSALFSGWRSFLRIAAVWGLAVGLSTVLVMAPPPIPTGDPTRAIAGAIRYYEIPPPVVGATLINATRGEAALIGTEVLSAGTGILSGGRGVGGGGLTGRIEIWRTSSRLITDRPWFDSDGSHPPILRHLFGYGPDMFKYTYLLERIPRGPDRIVISERFAHNLLIQRGVELGYLGMLATLGLFAAPALVSGYLLILRRNRLSSFHLMALVGLMGTFSGRFLEQMVGVAAISDLTIFWVLLALFAALPAVTREPQMDPDPDSVSNRDRRSHRSNAPRRIGVSGMQLALPAVVAVCLIFGVFALTWDKSINYLEAGFNARDGLDELSKNEFQDALVSLDRAIELAPDISTYYAVQAAVYQGYLRLDDGAMEPDCDDDPQGTPYQSCLQRKIISSHREAAKHRPFDRGPRLATAESTLNLSSLEGDQAMAQEAIGLFKEVAELDPQSWWTWQRLAVAHFQSGQPQSALAPLEKSLAILEDTTNAAFSRLVLGMAYYNLGESETALRFFNEAIRIKPNFIEAYANRGGAYNDLGRYNQAIKDLDKAIKSNPEMAMAFNNRGNSYANLDQLHKAIQDYDVAIRLDPQFILAYSNRALANTYLGRDDDASLDIQRGIELGLDPGPISARIEEVKRNRRKPNN